MPSNVITTRDGAVAGKAFLDHAAVRKIAFTGSTEVGKRLMAGASEQLKRISFELGGTAPFIVFEDADLAGAADGAVAIKFLRVGGQSCICANRVYVQASIAERFIPMFVDRVKALRVAPGFDSGAQIGPLISTPRFSRRWTRSCRAHRDKGRGAAGGRTPPRGRALRQWVFLRSDGSHRRARGDGRRQGRDLWAGRAGDDLRRRSGSGPALKRDAIRSRPYFYTRDLRRSIRVAEALEYGMVGVNDATGYTHEIPFGGFKQSGLGREGGHQGIEEYTEVKSISLAV
jgi:succinate-semialdehyde dehydrogenase/glutarate-semialdehyde dehydrogenase